MACLLGSILAVWDGLAPHVGGHRDILGMAWVPEWPGDPEWAGLHSGSSGSSVLVDPGIQDPSQVGGDLELLGPTIN